MKEPADAQPCPAQGDDLTTLAVAADPALLADGWVRRHLADAQRADESVALYRSMGYEVKVQPLTPRDFGPQCAQCAAASCHACVLIYTRQPAPESAPTTERQER